jgi:hypothetical protein
MVLSIRYSTIQKEEAARNTFSNNIVGTSYHLKGSLFKINPKTANDKKN